MHKEAIGELKFIESQNQINSIKLRLKTITKIVKFHRNQSLHYFIQQAFHFNQLIHLFLSVGTQHSHYFSEVFCRFSLFTFMAWSSLFTWMKPPSTLSRMLVAGHTKALSTFSWFLAEVSMYSMSQSLASFRAQLRWTTLSWGISVLFPMSTKTTSLLLLFLTSSTQRLTLRKVSLRVRSKTTRAAAEDLQYERVMARNSSWPAVSQICSLIILLLIVMLLDPYSTPMVYSWLGQKLPSMRRLIRLVFPTPVSPTRMNLKEQSNLFWGRLQLLLYIGSFILEFNFVIYNVTKYKLKCIISSNIITLEQLLISFLISSNHKNSRPTFHNYKARDKDINIFIKLVIVQQNLIGIHPITNYE